MGGPGQFSIQNNPLLATIGLGLLDDVGADSFTIVNNPALPVCDITMVYDGLSNAPGTHDCVTGNLACN